MYATVSGIYENGQVFLKETAPTQNRMNVLVVFMEESNQATPENTVNSKSSFSKRWQGKFKLNEAKDDDRMNYLKARYQL